VSACQDAQGLRLAAQPTEGAERAPGALCEGKGSFPVARLEQGEGLEERALADQPWDPDQGARGLLEARMGPLRIPPREARKTAMDSRHRRGEGREVRALACRLQVRALVRGRPHRLQEPDGAGGGEVAQVQRPPGPQRRVPVRERRDVRVSKEHQGRSPRCFWGPDEDLAGAEQCASLPRGSREERLRGEGSVGPLPQDPVVPVAQELHQGLEVLQRGPPVGRSERGRHGGHRTPSAVGAPLRYPPGLL
jgi:hypothetical protein